MEAQGNHTEFTQAGNPWICVAARNCPALFLPWQTSGPARRLQGRPSVVRSTVAMTSAGISSHVLRTARGEDTATSDIDLALDLAPERTPPGVQVRRVHRALETETGYGTLS